MEISVPETRQLLAEYIAKHERKQSHISREMGVSTAVLSQFLSDTYPGDNVTVAQKAMQFLEMGAARERMAGSAPICLSVGNTQKILREVKMAHEANHILLVYGPAGCSKTMTLKYYAQNTNGVIYVEADATISSQRNILISVLEELGETPQRASTAQIMRKILSLVHDTNRLLIIDEAQHLNERAFDTLRAINDKAKIGIIFSGNRSILGRMFGRKEPEYDTLFSRIGGFCELYNQHTLEDISGIYKNFFVNEKCAEHLQRVATRKGGLRRMDKEYRLAVNIANTLQQDLSLPLLQEADKRLNVIGRAM